MLRANQRSSAGALNPIRQAESPSIDRLTGIRTTLSADRRSVQRDGAEVDPLTGINRTDSLVTGDTTAFYPNSHSTRLEPTDFLRSTHLAGGIDQTRLDRTRLDISSLQGFGAENFSLGASIAQTPSPLQRAAFGGFGELQTTAQNPYHGSPLPNLAV